MFRDDPIYLCGLYEAKLRAIRNVINNLSSGYIEPASMKLLKDLLDINGPVQILKDQVLERLGNLSDKEIIAASSEPNSEEPL
jgi:hypothetical protein